MDIALPILYTVFLWWFSTGLVLYLDGLSPRTFRWSMAGGTAVLALAVVALVAISKQASVGGAYVAFTAAVLVWGWLEMAYFMGVLTGPRKAPCPRECGQWRRFRLAVQTSLYHELAVIVVGSLLLVLTWDSPNSVGASAFLILWAMRWSAKLNVFLGVRNLNEGWLPQHLSFLSSYFGRRPINLLFPVSVSVATALAVLLAQDALTAHGFSQTAACLLTALLVLGILEHWFLVLPISGDALWNWGARSHRSPMASSADVQPPLPGSAEAGGDHEDGLRRARPAPAPS